MNDDRHTQQEQLEELASLRKRVRELEQALCRSTDRDPAMLEQDFARQIIDSSMDGILAYDREFRYTCWNPTMERICGKRHDEVIGRVALDVFPFLRKAGVEDAFMAALAGETVHLKDRHYDVPDTNRYGIFDGHYAPMRDRHGEIIGVLGIVHDVTERHQAEQAVHKTSQRLQQLIDALPTYIAYMDRDHRYRFNNLQYEKWLDVPRENLRGMHLRDVVGETTYQQVLPYLNRAFNGENVSYETDIEEQDGRHYYAVNNIPDVQDNEVVGIFVLVNDITRQKHEAMYLREAQRLAGLARWDLDILNDYCEMTGENSTIYGDEKRVYKDKPIETWLATVHPDDRARLRKIFEDAIQQGEHFDFDYRVVKPDGSIYYAQDHAVVIRNKCGKAIRVTGTTQDITRYKEIEMALTQARDEAQQANRAKSEFLSLMSHELRTPLNAILGFAQLLEMRENAEDARVEQKYAKPILDAGWHLLELISDLLDLARIESNRLELHMESVLIGKSLRECLALIAPVARQRGISLKLEKRGCENMAILADPVRLKQVILNLLSNAVKYNRENGSVDIHCLPGANDRLRLCIRDTGSGIAEQDMDTLFEPFKRHANAHIQEGTGIGLTITKQLTELMGGTIGVESQTGRGSTFWVEFAMQRHEAAAADSSVNDAGGTQQDTGSKPHTLLYIEDSPAHTRLMEDLFHNDPEKQLLTANTPRIGLELAQAHLPDLILLDICLPGMDGYEVYQALQDNAATRHIPVIALSAAAMPAELERGLRTGFRRYLTKPINVTELRRVVDEILADQP